MLVSCAQFFSSVEFGKDGGNGPRRAVAIGEKKLALAIAEFRAMARLTKAKQNHIGADDDRLSAERVRSSSENQRHSSQSTALTAGSSPTGRIVKFPRRP